MMVNTDNSFPSFRKLRGYAFDPSLSLKLDTSHVNCLTYKISWEKLYPQNDESFDKEKWKELYDQNGIGPRSFPCGEYIEIIDYDPSSECFYEPVNLDHPKILAEDGLEPNVSDPKFHQQMVYAVIMTTIKNFEDALGRRVLWAEHFISKTENKTSADNSEFVKQLRVYPHALRQGNAYYDPFRKALLFGYFPMPVANRRPDSSQLTVFTCLSHDIITHETTHALLDGIHRKFIDDSNPDTLAFHEAFADIVALFQHFSFPEILKHQIAKTKGNLNEQNLLGQLAQQLGQAMGNYGSLRDAIGQYDENNVWHKTKADPNDYHTETDSHKRGSILVAAVFEVFLNIYKKRVASLLRLATGGTGILPNGDIHPDLVNHMAETAATVAAHILRICIRALDYCPYADITFGDYLRAIVTADKDMLPDDKGEYRVAFSEAFQERGIIPDNVKSMSVEELAYPNISSLINEKQAKKLTEFLREFKEEVFYKSDRKEIYEVTKDFARRKSKNRERNEGLLKILDELFINERSERQKFNELTGLYFPESREEGIEQGLIYASEEASNPLYKIRNLWLANRVTPEGKILNHVVIIISQTRRVTLDEQSQAIGYSKKANINDGQKSILLRGGCTLVFDLDTGKPLYAIKKNLNDPIRARNQFLYIHGNADNKDNSTKNHHTYFSRSVMNNLAGPFAFTHAEHNHL